MKSRPTLFLSGVSSEFKTFRDAVASEILTKGGFPQNQTDFHPDYGVVEEMLRRRLSEADAMIHLVGFRFGAEPKQRPAGKPRRSYTQMEFDIAKELNKRVYIFLSPEAGIRDTPAAGEAADATEAADAIALQLAHRQAVQHGDDLYCTFKDRDDLRRQVAQIPPVAAAEFKADIARIGKYAPDTLIGREAEIQRLNDAWMQVRRAETQRPHILSFVALGGEGKTSLVAKWAAELAHENWPGCDAVFAWSFYSQGTKEQSAAGSELFLNEALIFFGDAAMAASAQGGVDKAKRLAALVGERRTLLILDGVEPLQYSPASPTPGELKDAALSALLKALAATSHGLCVLTTRYSIPDLKNFWQTTAPEIKLLRLSPAAGVALLRHLGVHGTQPEYERLVADVKGHALTLNLLGSYLVDAHAGDIRRRDLIKLAEANAEEQGGHAFHVMDAYVQWFKSGGRNADENQRGQGALALLQLLGLFDRPASADCLNALLQAPAIPSLTEALVDLSEAQRNVALKRLEEARLLSVSRDAAGRLLALDTHPLLREYFAGRMQKEQNAAWRAAHRRIYEHLCATTQEGEKPSLEDLQPLYQAVAHGCLAGMQQETRDEVYRKRIQRGADSYATSKLGAIGSDLGAVACFFVTPWKQVSPALSDADHVWALAVAAFDLHSLGRLTEALEPARTTLKMNIKQGKSKYAASSASNLSELLLTLGQIDGDGGALDLAEQATGLAEMSNDTDQKVICLVTFGDAMHQAGLWTKAQYQFEKAERIQADYHRRHPFLKGLQGFQYCDLLLAAPERAASQIAQTKGTNLADLASTCDAIVERATRTLSLAEKKNKSLLDIALGYLTLGRAALYQSVLGDGRTQQTAKKQLDNAVTRLRIANANDYLPRGLLTRAWLRRLMGAHNSALADLDEAWEIAERGPMPLHMADIHLHRARLFGLHSAGNERYPWQSPEHDLKAARRLIEQHGYWRRKEELEDAEAALFHPPNPN